MLSLIYENPWPKIFLLIVASICLNSVLAHCVVSNHYKIDQNWHPKCRFYAIHHNLSTF